MDVDIMEQDGNKRIHQRLGQSAKQQRICYFWQQGKCAREDCRFLHSGSPGGGDRSGGPSSGFGPSKRNFQSIDERNLQVSGLNPARNVVSKWGRGGGRMGGQVSDGEPRNADMICRYWLQGNCRHGDGCKFLHPFVLGGDFTNLTLLEGHKKAIRGIALPSGSDKLYSGSQDESVRVWDCQTGQCVTVVNLGGEIGCLISEGPWLFVGIPNMVKAWDTQTNTELSLSGPRGQVYALTVGNEMLFAGTQDGSILAWKFNVVGNCFEPAASLTGHNHPVVSMTVGVNRLYSGSMDGTIRVWDLESLCCIQTLTEHTSVAMSLLCWDQFLLSCSLDKAIKAWGTTDNGRLEVTFTHNEEHGVLALCGMHDAQNKPILLCSCNDNVVRIYDLPSFNERGKIFSKAEVRAIQIGPGGLFFTGDGAGELKVWKMNSPAA